MKGFNSAADRATGSGPLSGVRVAAFTQFLLGPSAVSYLAELGADVVSVEPLGGSWERNWSGGDTMRRGASIFYKMTHRNVRSLALDLKRPEGLEVAWRLIEQSEVLVQNFRPGVMARFGLDYDTVHARYPAVVYASCSGWGTSGERRTFPGQDLLLQAFSGLASINGRADMPPIACGAPVIDQHGASLFAMGILASLVGVARSGEGDHVHLTMLAAALDLQQEPLTYHLNGGRLRRSAYGVSAPDHEAPYGIYPCRGGHIVLSMVPLPRLCDALALEFPAVWATDTYQFRDEISQALFDRLADEPLEELHAELSRADIWCEPVQDYAQMVESRAFSDIDPIGAYDDPEVGEVAYLRTPVKFASFSDSLRSIPPVVGQDSAEVLAQLGYEGAEIEALSVGDVVRLADVAAPNVEGGPAKSP